ncbi:RING finger protein 37 [Eufriesea mexicana]|uniref:RING finger protein 37 n=1 Tax=Eufriesea mexicana TaxID=516756 RepID=A0A310SNH0_9HYME|nr:PREDICTED: RING finger protein 37 [Eufriesea mexicana]OAD58897.1 RING finger protein 37 [Eufriesea mexicana]
MLFNFCDPRLRPEIQCSTINTEGYEVSNLINDSDKGFLAYACIKPPINIDITFLCNVCINHILIWPQVGSQKSSGFQLYAKTSNDTSVPYALLATGFLDSTNAGLLFYPSTINHETISAPSNFLRRYIKPSLHYLTTYINSLRICICKTENSVPALGKIEVWGTVSPRCGKDTAASILILWSKQQSCLVQSVEKSENTDSLVTATHDKEILESNLQVPECFLDAITYDIMTQPILLPSGKIIDQSTLLKHEETEAIWGRRLTDPFTGLPFSEERKPVIATALKIRIDKFLLENSNVEEIKKLPRVLGRALPSDVTNEKIAEVPKYLLKRNIIKSSNNNKPKLQCSVISTQANKKVCHKLPVVITSKKRTIPAVPKSAKKKLTANSCVSVSKNSEDKKKSNSTDSMDLTVNNEKDFNINIDVPNLKRFNNIPKRNEPSPKLTTCSCCPNGIFYELPCKHILCRKVLTSIKNNQCTSCETPYKNNEIKRIYE